MFRKIKRKISDYRVRIKRSNEIVMEVLQAYFQAHAFILKFPLKRYLLFSGLFFLILFAFSIRGLLFGISKMEEPVTTWLLEHANQYLTLSEDKIKTGITAGFWLARKVIDSNKDSIFLFLFFIIGVPYFSFISSKTEQYHTGKQYTFSFKTFFKELKRGLRISIYLNLKQLYWLAIISLFSLIPYIGVLSPLFVFIVKTYYSGILMTDYSLERHQFDTEQSKVFYKNHKSEMFAIGLGMMFLILIPVIGWFLAPTYAIVTSTLLLSESKKQAVL